MRLLYKRDGKFKLTKYMDHDIPEYAILSHTWGPENEEVTFQDLLNGTEKRKASFCKIEFCHTRAKHDSLQYFWVDSCCIDKSNRVELSQAIDSMFRWYQKAARCYVYLTDVSFNGRQEHDTQSEDIWMEAFQVSRWFSRGWTLQELLAPASVEFFSKEGQRLGDKRSLGRYIPGITGISDQALKGDHLSRFSIKERFRWAETRITKREEDWAYCLQGIFGVSMPVIYGEGKTLAVSRLEKEITKNQQCLEELQTTDPRDDKERIEQTKGGLLRHCYKWILGNNHFKEWRSGQRKLLWVGGDPGKGKTMLLCGVINELGKLPATNMSYFFCQATDTRINNATAVLRGLVFLLVNQQPLLIRDLREKYDQSGKQLFNDPNGWIALCAMFHKILRDPDLVPTYLVIDALDECVVGLNDLLSLIIQTSTATYKVKWIVSSRNWPIIEKVFTKEMLGFSLSLELNESSLSEAVATYIKMKVETLAICNDYDDETRNNVMCHLTQNAGGTFLWVALVCQDLANMSSWEVSEESLGMFPPGLDDLYKRMMSQVCKSRHSQLCKSILAALSIVFRPITLDDLPSLVEIPPRAVGNDKALTEIIGTCGSFLSLRDRSIFFTHHTAKEFLTDQETEKIFPSGKEIEHQAIFRRCINSMSQVLRKDMYNMQRPGIMIEQVDRQRPTPDPLAPISYACVYWINHLCETQAASDYSIMDAFLEKHFLHWLEALSILQITPQGVNSLSEYISLLVSTAKFSNITMLKDMYRFAQMHRRTIASYPLQTYASALVFSPFSTLAKTFEFDSPTWIIRRPHVRKDWKSFPTPLEGHKGLVTCIVSTADGRRVASGSDDKAVKIWDAESGKCTTTLEDHSRSITCMVFSADGQRVASGSYDNIARIWDIESSSCVNKLEQHSEAVTCLVFSTDGRRIVSGSNDRTLKIWNTMNGDCAKTLEGHRRSIISVAFSADDLHIASGSCDKTIKIWQADSGDCEISLMGHEAWISSVAFSEDSRRVASGSYDRTIKIWDVKSGTCVMSWDVGRSLRRLKFSTTSSRLDTEFGAISIEDESTTAITPAGPTEIRFQSPRQFGYRISSDGSWITWNGQNVLFLPEHSRPRASGFEVCLRTIFVACPSGRVWSIRFSSTESAFPSTCRY